MNIEQDKILEKLVQYIDGQLGSAEKEEIRQWITDNKEIERQYNQLLQADILMNQEINDIPSERMTARFKDWLNTYESDIKKTHIKKMTWYRIAAGLAILVVAAGGFMTIQKVIEQKAELAVVKEELKATKALVINKLNDQNSASQRMTGIYASQNLTNPDAEILEVLIDAMNGDPSSNVRMAALESLSKYYQNPAVRTALIQSINHQDDPVVQIALIQLLVRKKETVIVDKLEVLTREENLIKAVKDEAYKGIFKLT